MTAQKGELVVALRRLRLRIDLDLELYLNDMSFAIKIGRHPAPRNSYVDILDTTSVM